MELLDFFEGMKTEDDGFKEKVAGAEHFIRLKKQAGLRKSAFMPPTQASADHRKSLSPVPELMAQMPMPQSPEAMALQTQQPPQQPPQDPAQDPAMQQQMMMQDPAMQQQPAPQPMMPPGQAPPQPGMPMQQPPLPGPQLAKLAARLNTSFRKKAGLDPRMVALMGIGGAAGAAGTYLSSRPQKNLDGKSWEEDVLERRVSSDKARPEGGLARKLVNQTTETSHGIAKAFREHPGKASLIGAAGGAMGAMGIGKMLGLALKLKGNAK